EEVLQAGKSIVETPPLSVIEALKALIDQYYDHSLVYLSKAMWRTAMAMSIQQPDSPFSKRYTELDCRLCGQVSTLVRKLQLRGAIRPGVDAEAVDQMFFNNLNMMFMEFVKEEAMTLENLKQRVGRQNQPLATLIAGPVAGA
ncbi:MAG: TetR/AcrR family transcriptional regulator, partial [Bradyrhizobium sp.]